MGWAGLVLGLVMVELVSAKLGLKGLNRLSRLYTKRLEQVKAIQVVLA